MIQMTVLACAALLAFLVSAISGKYLVPVLHKMKFGQTIREIGPAWHKNKQGTPTMGGVMFILGFVVALFLVVVVCEAALPEKPLSSQASIYKVRFFAGVLMALACGAIGFADDYIKVVKKRNLGLTSSQKMILQIVVGASYAAVLYFMGGYNDPDVGVMAVPFVGNVHIGWWFLPLCVFFTVGFSNATNLTDGVDGLCGSITVVASVCLMGAATMTGFFGQSIIASAFAGAVAGFLVWNLHPAKVFMGDTGSLLIGGLLCAVAFGIGRPLLLLPVGVMYIVETLSVMLQVSYFKLTHGKRLFKMSPIHHHFEMCGWSENKIVTVFSVVTALCGALALVFGSY